MLFSTPVAAGELEDARNAYRSGDYQKTLRLFQALPAGEIVRLFQSLPTYDDYEKYLPLVQALAELGNVVSQFNLGKMYAGGLGIPEDDAKAVYAGRIAQARLGVPRCRAT